MTESCLRTDRLAVGYGKQTVVENITINVEPGKILCLIGPNGAGKSTLLRTLIRELPPVGGTVFLDGRDLSSFRGKELAKRRAAVLTGRPEPELMSCEEVVETGRYPYTGRLGTLSREDREVVLQCMEQVGILPLREKAFNRISDGQRQRVLLARALCQKPKLLILDEPTSFLDLRYKLDFLQLLRDLVRSQQIAAVLSMHELDLAQRFSDRLLCIRNGQIDRAGTPEEIFIPGYIEHLYGLDQGSYDIFSGSAEAEKLEGAPKVFVLGGGGSGIQVYRKLRRLGIPFAVGVLQENDMDLPTARALAAVVITDRAYEKVSPEKVDEALEVLRNCGTLICTAAFGGENRENQRLLDWGRKKGILLPAEELEEKYRSGE